MVAFHNDGLIGKNEFEVRSVNCRGAIIGSDGVYAYISGIFWIVFDIDGHVWSPQNIAFARGLLIARPGKNRMGREHGSACQRYQGEYA